MKLQECPKCKKLIKTSECPYCGIVVSKFSTTKPIKSFYTASYKDINALEILKRELKNYNSLTITEKTKLLANAQRYGLLDFAAYQINKNKGKDLDIDNKLIEGLNKLNLNSKRDSFFSLKHVSKPVLFSVSLILAIVFIFFILNSISL